MTGFAALDPCVHCGFCLQSCPTYVATGDEADGPRGRIILMQQLGRGRLAATDPTLQYHLDRCLGCRACATVCPSGVRYGPALEEARERIAAIRPLEALTRLTLSVVASPAIRGPLLALARLLRPVAGPLAGWSRMRFGVGMLAGTIPWSGTDRSADLRVDRSMDPPINRPTRDARRRPGPAVVFLGCIQRELFRHVNAAATRTLAANGYAIARAPDQACCGALHAHAGRLHEARALARRNVQAFAACPDARIAVTAAGCGAMLREYGALLADDPLASEAKAFAARVRDVTELLADAGPLPGAEIPVTVAYDAPCHLLHAQGVAEAPLAVLRAVPGVRVTPHAEADACCGSAGLYSLLQRDLSFAVLRRKLDALRAADPAVVVTGNPGCAMHLAAGLRAAGLDTPVAHPVELLDASYAAAGWYARGIDSQGT